MRRVRTVRHPWRLLAVLCTIVASASFGAANAGAASAQCEAGVNDTPSKLLPCITTDDLMAHMRNLDLIAKQNPSPADGHPSRNSGEPGYLESALYVARVMTAAGYNVHIQTYPFNYFAFTGQPTWSEISPTARNFTLSTDWNPGQATGSAKGAIQPDNGIVIPPTATPSSASGCTPANFIGFVPGRIALLQRGTCNFGVKVQNAQAAGAAGVIIFNEGNPGRTDVLSGSLVDAAGNPIIPTIPVAFTSFAIGESLFNEYQQAVQSGSPLPQTSIATPAKVQENAPDYNVIAESKGGDRNHVVVVDAHLDAIFGEGMLDNASGSVTILDIAQQMKNVTPRNKLRFIWFGGEELGLLGSNFYVNNLTHSELNHIGYDLDADVTATPNYVVGVLDPAGPDLFTRTPSATFPNRVYKASGIARDIGINYFSSIGLNHELFSPVGTDAFSFNTVGIPASGVLTGQDCCKTPGDVALFGGSLGNFEGNVPGFDGGCVDNPFLWCDNLSNNDPNVLTFMSRGFATMVLGMAFDTKVMSASGNAVFNQKLPITGEVGRRLVTH